MQKNDWVSWDEAVEFDNMLRANGNRGKFYEDVFLHSSCQPLEIADLGDDRTLDLFQGECDGMCGV